MPARKTAPPKPSRPNRRPIRREVGALVCFILAVLTIFSLFGAGALVLDAIRDGLKLVVGGGFFDEPTVGRRRILSFRQSIDFIVYQYNIDIDITSHRMDEMIPADSQTIAITGNKPYAKIRT